MQNILRLQGQSAVIDPTLYDEVYSGEVDCKDLEGVYKLFNSADTPLTHRGNSLSVSDVLATQYGYYFVDSVGFEPIQFDEALTHKPDNLLHAVIIEPGKPAYKTEIENALTPMQRLVGGYLEMFCPFEDNAVIVCNEEGKIKGLPFNRTVHGEPMVGNLVIIGDDGEGSFCSLTDEQIQRYLAEFQSPEVTDPGEDLDSGISMT
jgi:hypothetical protein